MAVQKSQRSLCKKKERKLKFILKFKKNSHKVYNRYHKNLTKLILV